MNIRIVKNLNNRLKTGVETQVNRNYGKRLVRLGYAEEISPKVTVEPKVRKAKPKAKPKPKPTEDKQANNNNTNND